MEQGLRGLPMLLRPRPLANCSQLCCADLQQMVQHIIVRIIRWRGFRPRPFKFKLQRADGMTKSVCVWHGRPQDPNILVAVKGWHCVSDRIKDCGLNGSLEAQKVFAVA